jgi:hypothetical protein
MKVRAESQSFTATRLHIGEPPMSMGGGFLQPRPPPQVPNPTPRPSNTRGAPNRHDRGRSALEIRDSGPHRCHLSHMVNLKNQAYIRCELVSKLRILRLYRMSQSPH